MSAQGKVPHDDYQSGFIAGWQAIKGTLRVIPVIPVEPVTKVNFTRFLMGLRKGIEKAGGRLSDD